jgi:hypothetical protein
MHKSFAIRSLRFLLFFALVAVCFEIVLTW